jgi:hypothetical protein
MPKILRPFYGQANKGRFMHRDPEEFARYMRTFEDGTDIEIYVQRKKKLRTSGQPGECTNFNGYYWGVIVRMVAEEMGEMDTEYVSKNIELMVGNFKSNKNGDKIPLGTSKMTGGEFAEYCSKARIWASKFLHLNIPEPHEYETI